MNNGIFSELLFFLNDHPDMTFISYGEAGVEQGTSAPLAWLAWDQTGSPPWAENAWFVIRADKGSIDLTGDGSRQWQLKVQVSNLAAYADASGINYGENGNIGRVVCRFSPDGGWVGGGTRDFVAVTASGDMLFSEDTASDEDFNLHLAGDNETIVSYGQLKTGLTTPDYRYGRAGYFGQIVRRSANHLKPEYAMVPRMIDATESAIRPICSRINSANYQFATNYSATQVRSTFSIAADDDPVEFHHHAGLFALGSDEFQQDMDPDPWTGEIEQVGCMIRQREGIHQSLLGQLRHFSLISNAIVEGNLTGDGTVYSCGYSTGSYVGVGFPWPGSGTAPLF
jgi:hypothetical protein